MSGSTSTLVIDCTLFGAPKIPMNPAPARQSLNVRSVMLLAVTNDSWRFYLARPQ
jgi:hypothetical protein